MSKLYEVAEAAMSLNVHEDTILNWIKKGVIKYEKVEEVYLIPHAEIFRIKNLRTISKNEPFKRELNRVGINYYESLCANGQYDTVARDLGLPEPPKNVKQCYSMVYQVLGKRMYKDTHK